MAGSVALFGAGCSSPSHHSTAGPPASGIATIAQPVTKGPPICHHLAASVPLRQLPSALELQSDASLGGEARTVIAAASVQLHQFARTADDPLASKLDAAGTALARLGSTGGSSASGSAQAATALNTLGQEVQTECDFPVG